MEIRKIKEIKTFTSELNGLHVGTMCVDTYNRAYLNYNHAFTNGRVAFEAYPDAVAEISEAAKEYCEEQGFHLYMF